MLYNSIHSLGQLIKTKNIGKRKKNVFWAVSAKKLFLPYGGGAQNVTDMSATYRGIGYYAFLYLMHRIK